MQFLYEFKSSALAWRNNLAEVLGKYMGFKYLLENLGVRFKEPMDKDINQNCIYILVYVDDILFVETYPSKLMYMLMDNYTAKT